MPFGSLADHLFGSTLNRTLDWHTRMEIAAGAARRLKYLHSKNIIHGDLRSSNVLLGEGNHPKVTDFGLGRKSARHGVMLMNLDGFVGYGAPEYARVGQFVYKSDVYSLGVVLLELIAGRRAVDWEIRQSIIEWARPIMDAGGYKELIDPSLKDQYPLSDLKTAVSIANDCTKFSIKKRPEMEEVVARLASLTQPPPY